MRWAGDTTVQLGPFSGRGYARCHDRRVDAGRLHSGIGRVFGLEGRNESRGHTNRHNTCRWLHTRTGLFGYSYWSCTALMHSRHMHQIRQRSKLQDQQKMGRHTRTTQRWAVTGCEISPVFGIVMYVLGSGSRLRRACVGLHLRSRTVSSWGTGGMLPGRWQIDGSFRGRMSAFPAQMWASAARGLRSPSVLQRKPRR